MATVFDRIANKYDNLPDILAKAYAALVILTVREYAKAFKNSVEAQTPFATGDLKNSIKLTETYRNGKYGYRVAFLGKNDYDVPFQLIANTLNYGRTAGISKTGRAISVYDRKHIGFITRNLEILSNINPTLARNIVIGGWSVTDTEVTLNDGQSFTLTELESYANLLKSIEE